MNLRGDGELECITRTDSQEQLSLRCVLVSDTEIRISKRPRA